MMRFAVFEMTKCVFFLSIMVAATTNDKNSDSLAGLDSFFFVMF